MSRPLIYLLLFVDGWRKGINCLISGPPVLVQRCFIKNADLMGILLKSSPLTCNRDRYLNTFRFTLVREADDEENV